MTDKTEPSEAAAQPKRNKQIPEETFSDEIRLGKRKLCGHLAPCDCQNGIFQAEIEHNDHIVEHQPTPVRNQGDSE